MRRRRTLIPVVVIFIYKKRNSHQFPAQLHALENRAVTSLVSLTPLSVGILPYNGNMNHLEAHLILEALEKMTNALEAMEERMAEIFATTIEYSNDDYDL